MMVAAQVVGNDATIAWANALGSNFDLNVMMPVIAYNLLQSIDLLSERGPAPGRQVHRRRANSLRARRPAGSSRIEADEERCRQLIEKSLAMCTALAPRIGYDNAAAIAKTAYHEEPDGPGDREWSWSGSIPTSVAARLGQPASAAALRAKGGFPSLEEVERLLDPYNQTIRGTGIARGYERMIEENQNLNLETDHLEEVIESPPPGQPVVVIQYRTRGVPWYLALPLLVLVPLGAVAVYHRVCLARPLYACAAHGDGPIVPEGGRETGRHGVVLRSVGKRRYAGAAPCLDCGFWLSPGAQFAADRAWITTACPAPAAPRPNRQSRGARPPPRRLRKKKNPRRPRQAPTWQSTASGTTAATNSTGRGDARESGAGLELAPHCSRRRDPPRPSRAVPSVFPYRTTTIVLSLNSHLSESGGIDDRQGQDRC